MPTLRRKKGRNHLRFRFETLVCIGISARQSPKIRHLLANIMETVKSNFPIAFVLLLIGEEVGRRMLSYQDYAYFSTILLSLNTPLWCFYQVMHPLSFVWNEIAFSYLPRKVVVESARNRENMWILFSLLHILAVMLYFPCYILYRFSDAIGPLLHHFPMLLLLLPKFSSELSSTFNYVGFMTGREPVLVLEDIAMNGIGTGDLPDRGTDNMGKFASSSSSMTMVICDLGAISMALATISIIQTLVHILSRDSSKCISSSTWSNCGNNSKRNKDRGKFPASLLSPEDLECHSDSSTYATASMWLGYSCILYAAASAMDLNKRKSAFVIPLAMLVLMPMVQFAYVVYECGRTYSTFMRLAAFLTLILFLMTANAILEADQEESLHTANN
mmetsp:Transcript_32873/g.55815  ORF Transcript_32873/g.55815 Transcript_32873/m.55815 type:complete len:388 (+) Transcript_32873:145-1308(+)